MQEAGDDAGPAARPASDQASPPGVAGGLLLEVDPDGVLTAVDGALTAVDGAPAAPAPGRDAVGALAPLLGTAGLDALRSALQRGRATSFPAGGAQPLHVSVRPWRGGHHLVHVAPADARADALVELRARAAQQEAAAELGRLALGGAELPVLLQRAADAVAGVLPGADVGVLELADGVLHARTTRARPDLPVRLELADIPGTTIEAALRTGAPAHVADYAAHGPAPALRARTGVASAASVPVRTAEGTWGVLSVTHTRPGGVGEQELLFLQQVAHLLGAAADRAAAEERIRHQSLHDALTGLPNRVRLRQLLDEALAPGAEPCALMILDLDGFKDVNDALGHAVGDRVLQQVAPRIAAAVGERGTVARLGGDEFAVLLRPDAEAEAVAADVRAAFAAPFGDGALAIPLDVSIGIALGPVHGNATSTMLRQADVAMYRAKSTGSGWATYSSTLDAPQMLRLSLIAELRTAIAAGQLELHYQPVVSVQTGRLRSLEALVRWRHPERGLVPPQQFIPLAERSQLIGPLTLWVVNEALQRCAELGRAGLEVPRVAVNLSMHCLADARSAAAVRARLIDASDVLSVEVTETALADERAREFLEDLAGHGVSVSVDDFGTGYASLAHLRALPVEQLKIDRTFVEHLEQEPRDRAIVRTVVDLARALDLTVVAEGVESEVVAERLREIGVGLGQGFLWSPALPAAEFAAWLAGSPHGAQGRAPGRTRG